MKPKIVGLALLLSALCIITARSDEALSIDGLVVGMTRVGVDATQEALGRKGFASQRFKNRIHYRTLPQLFGDPNIGPEVWFRDQRSVCVVGLSLKSSAGNLRIGATPAEVVKVIGVPDGKYFDRDTDMLYWCYAKWKLVVCIRATDQVVTSFILDENQ